MRQAVGGAFAISNIQYLFLSASTRAFSQLNSADRIDVSTPRMASITAVLLSDGAMRAITVMTEPLIRKEPAHCG
ncbi:hypothetical protein CWO89_34720 [Bradyrhizobium sp. Leo170]|nr:hypothetical protein CWO90_39580 [Bradyrhizobium sp. Leo121]TAI61527.1 hypothetical protein CWO89_34720 [Bradyrhizobium sp. Leo170]